LWGLRHIPRLIGSGDLKLLTDLHHRDDSSSGPDGAFNHGIKKMGVTPVPRWLKRDIMGREDQPPARLGVESNDVFDESQVVGGPPIEKKGSKKIQIDSAGIDGLSTASTGDKPPAYGALHGHVRSVERIGKHWQSRPRHEPIQSYLIRDDRLLECNGRRTPTIEVVESVTSQLMASCEQGRHILASRDQP
jgi:hypothetical protein